MTAVEVFRLPQLPWGAGALAPVISSRTVQFHRDRHHANYVATANRLLRDRPDLASLSADQILLHAAKHEPNSPLYNSAAQAWNHAFYWRSLSPEKQRPSDAVRRALDLQFSDYARFANEFATAGARHFGSGWLWLLASSDGRLSIQTTTDADRPAARCLLAVDLWEHAYYLDHQDRRREYLDALIDRRINWKFADENLAANR